MAYSAEESSPMNEEYDTCCICNEEFSSDGELATHLLDHATEEKFKTLLEELESRIEKQHPLTSTPVRTGRPRSDYLKPNFIGQSPLKKDNKVPSGEPEIIDILSDDEEPSNQQSNAKRVKLSNNTFKPVNSVVSKTLTTKVLPSNQTSLMNNSSSVQNNSSSSANNSSSLLDNSSSEKGPSFQQQPIGSQDKPRPYVCEICKKSFAHKGTLRQHLHLHISEKSHECRICHKKFSIKSVLRKHEESHELQHLQEQRNKS